MLYIEVEDKEGLPKLIDLHQYVEIFIDVTRDQSPDNLDRYVWGRYDDGNDGNVIFSGTQVECINFVNKVKELLQAQKINIWDQ